YSSTFTTPPRWNVMHVVAGYSTQASPPAPPAFSVRLWTFHEPARKSKSCTSPVRTGTRFAATSLCAVAWGCGARPQATAHDSNEMICARRTMGRVFMPPLGSGSASGRRIDQASGGGPALAGGARAGGVGSIHALGHPGSGRNRGAGSGSAARMGRLHGRSVRARRLDRDHRGDAGAADGGQAAR